MSIGAECTECGREYRLPDEKAGRRIRCKDCGAVVDVPQRTARRPARASGARRSSSSSRRSRSSGGGIPKPLLVAGVVAAVTLCAGLAVYFGMQMLGGADDSALLSGGGAGSSTEDVGVTAADLTEEEKAARQAQYDSNLQQQRQAQSQTSRDKMAQRFGAQRVVTVVVDNVVGETEAANKYLQRKLFRAAYQEYEAGRKQAAAQTEANRKSAENQAVQDHKDTWGEFGPSFVQYRYELVDSDVPYPRIINAGRTGNTFTFYAAPASNVQQFSKSLGLGQVSSVNGRKITIQAQLPTPIPDPDVEELALQYGPEKVVRVHVSGATGDPKLVQLYLQNETTSARTDGSRLSMVAMKALGNGEYEFHAAPVSNPQVFGESISWGQLKNLDAASQTIEISATLPEHLPTESELKAAQAEERAREKAIRDADWAHKPRPGEAELDWVIRVIKDKDTFGIEKALKSLALMEVDEDRRDEVAKLLAQHLGETHFGPKIMIPAMLQWKTDDTEKAILRLGGSRLPSWDREIVMEALAELKTPATAEALASALPDFFSGDKSVRFLIDAGPVAEAAVLRYLKHEDAKVRARVYTVLSEIGGKDAFRQLRTNVKLENNLAMKAQAEAALEAVKSRIDAERDKSAADSDSTDSQS